MGTHTSTVSSGDSEFAEQVSTPLSTTSCYLLGTPRARTCSRLQVKYNRVLYQERPPPTHHKDGLDEETCPEEHRPALLEDRAADLFYFLPFKQQSLYNSFNKGPVGSSHCENCSTQMKLNLHRRVLWQHFKI
ncbi:Dnaj-like Subfamily C Member 9 [Manis pentadactyla]|nr:Dnaj-like Subfamily C Member 9 [Manis pentadactyla]